VRISACVAIVEIAFVNSNRTKETPMKNQAKNRIKIENLKAAHGAVEHKEMSANDLRQVAGGLMRLPEASSCTMDCDVDCD
jgi:hypothetical protein